MTNSALEPWNSRAKWLHWLIAFMILLEVPVGFVMAYTYGLKFTDPDGVGKLHVLMAQIHITNGFLILILVTYRLTWRFRNPVPGLPASLRTFQKLLAKATHTFLYVLLFVLPLSGWAANSVLGDTERFGVTELWFFAWDIMPPLLPQLPLDHPFGYGFFASIHRYAIYTGGVILSLHILAAIWHHFVQRDYVLMRMWPLADTSKSGESSEQ